MKRFERLQLALYSLQTTEPITPSAGLTEDCQEE